MLLFREGMLENRLDGKVLYQLVCNRGTTVFVHVQLRSYHHHETLCHDFFFSVVQFIHILTVFICTNYIQLYTRMLLQDKFLFFTANGSLSLRH